MTLPDLESVNYTLALCTLIGIPLAIWRSKSRKRISAAADAILGQESAIDNSGNVIRPAQPGLVHRVATVEDAVVEFRHAIGVYTEVLGRLDSVERDVKALQDRRVEHIVTAAERAATAATSAEMLRMVNERGTVDGHAEEQSPEELG